MGKSLFSLNQMVVATSDGWAGQPRVPVEAAMSDSPPGSAPKSPQTLAFGNGLENLGGQIERPVSRPAYCARHAFDPSLNSPATGWAATPSLPGPALPG
jgi:hypothetical protein